MGGDETHVQCDAEDEQAHLTAEQDTICQWRLWIESSLSVSLISSSDKAPARSCAARSPSGLPRV